jgi:hypothetical protein
MLGSSTFGIAMNLLRWLPVNLVDRFLLLVAKMILGDTEKYGLKRPKLGPLEIKGVTGKSPVLDVGAWSLIKSGDIKVWFWLLLSFFLYGCEVSTETCFLCMSFQLSIAFEVSTTIFFPLSLVE